MHDRSQTVVLVSSLLSIILLGVLIFFTAPRLKEQRLAAHQADRTVVDLQTKLAAITAGERTLLSAEAKVNKLLLAFPKEVDIPNALVMLEHIAASSGGLKFKHILPAEAKREGGLVTIPVTVSFDGSYDQFKKVIELLDRSLRSFTVETANVSQTETGITAVLQLTTYAQTGGVVSTQSTGGSDE